MRKDHVKGPDSLQKRKRHHLLWMLAFVVFFSVVLSLYSHLRYHRSAAATVAEFDLRLLLARQDQSELTEKLTSLLEEGKTTYEIPNYIRFGSDVETEWFTMHTAPEDTMQVFHLRPKDGSAEEAEAGSGQTSSIIIYYLHGGSYLDEPNPFHWETLDQLAQELGCEVIVPDYPMIPFATCDSSYPVVFAHYKALKEERPEARIILMGDSAGGGFALGLVSFLEGRAYLPRESTAAELFTPKTRTGYLPDGLVLLSPWVDVSMDNPAIDDYTAIDPMLKKDQLELCGKLWAGSRALTDPLVSPLYAFSDLSGTSDRLRPMQRTLSGTFPKTLLFAGTREMFYPDIMSLYDTLSGIGCDISLSVGEGMNHVWVVYPIPEGEAAVQEIETFIRQIQED